MDCELKYKEAIEKLRKLRDNWAKTDNRAAIEIEKEFPDLKERKTKQELLQFLYGASCGSTFVTTQEQFKDWHDWLENIGDDDELDSTDKYCVKAAIKQLISDLSTASFEPGHRRTMERGIDLINKHFKIIL